MTGQHDRDELVELISRYADMADTKDWDGLARSVLCDEFTCDFSSLGTPAATVTRDAWCQQTQRAFAGWTATHHVITSHRIVVDGDRATIRAHVRAEHWVAPEVAAGGPNCWLVVGFYDDVAVRTAAGWRLSSVTLTMTHQENQGLLAASMGAASPTFGTLIHPLRTVRVADQPTGADGDPRFRPVVFHHPVVERDPAAAADVHDLDLAAWCCWCSCEPWWKTMWQRLPSVCLTSMASSRTSMRVMHRAGRRLFGFDVEHDSAVVGVVLHEDVAAADRDRPAAAPFRAVLVDEVEHVAEHAFDVGVDAGRC